jgi:hypothetical protein
VTSGDGKPPDDETKGAVKTRASSGIVIAAPSRRPVPLGLNVQRLAPQPVPGTAATITRLTLEAPTQPVRAPRVYETIRIIDLARFRQSLRRHRSLLEKKGGDYTATFPARARLLALLETHYLGSSTIWPDVVVIRRPESGVIETNYAILGEAIFLGAHLSADWTEGRETDRFYETLAAALLEQGRVRQSQFEPLRGKGSADPDHGE